jgi:hypothetical protein
VNYFQWGLVKLMRDKRCETHSFNCEKHVVPNFASPRRISNTDAPGTVFLVHFE